MEIKQTQFPRRRCRRTRGRRLPARAQPAHPACLPAWASIPTRQAGKIDVLYKTKHGQPNGLALTDRSRPDVGAGPGRRASG